MNSNYTNWFGDSAKEKLDSYKNKYYKGIQDEDVEKDFYHDLNINKDGINKSKIYNQQTAQDVCAEYREKNKHLPRRYW